MRESYAAHTAEAAQPGGLDREECLRLLAKGVIGRVIFTDAALPAAQPVPYLLNGEEVLFGATAASKLATAARQAVVAFQADDIDPDTHTGWSILGVGQTHQVTDPEQLAKLAQHPPTARALTRTGQAIAIPLQRLTGQRLDLGGQAGDADSAGGRVRSGQIVPGPPPGRNPVVLQHAQAQPPATRIPVQHLPT